MKRLFLLLILAFVLISCGEKGEGDPFSVFSGEFEATVSMSCEGNISVYTYSSADNCIRFVSPEELTGYSMVSRDGNVYLSYGDISVELTEYSSRLMAVTEAVFSVTRDSITSINAEKDGETTVTVVTAENCEYRFSSDGIPISVMGNISGVSFEMTFTDFSVGEAK